MSPSYVYITASHKLGTLYIGVTTDLIKRIYEHRNNLVDGLTKKHAVHDLVYFEEYGDIMTAIEREKTLKHWNRQWKIDLIEKENPGWEDLFDSIVG